MEEILGIKERTFYNMILNIKGKEILYYGKRKLQDMLLTKDYVLKLTTIGN